MMTLRVSISWYLQLSAPLLRLSVVGMEVRVGHSVTCVTGNTPCHHHQQQASVSSDWEHKTSRQSPLSPSPTPPPVPAPRRSSCKDYRDTLARPGAGVKRTGSLQVPSDRRPVVRPTRGLTLTNLGRNSDSRLNIVDKSGETSVSTGYLARPPLPGKLSRHGSDR